MRREVGFIGKKRYEAANKIIPQAIKEWVTGWCFVGTQMEPIVGVQAVDSLNPEEIDVKSTFRQFGSSDNRIQIGYGNAEVWREVVFGNSSDSLPDDKISKSLLLNAQDALIDILHSALKQDDGQRAKFSGEDVLTIGGPCMIFKISMNRSVITCVVRADLLNSWLPRVASQKKLVSRDEAIGTVRVKLKVELPLAKIPVGSALSMSEQDVMCGDALLTQPFSLLTENGNYIGCGHLAKVDEKVVLQLRN